MVLGTYFNSMIVVYMDPLGKLISVRRTFFDLHSFLGPLEGLYRGFENHLCYLGAPCYNFRKMYPETLFWLVRSLF